MSYYLVELVDSDDGRRLNLGVYESDFEETAKKIAEKRYKNMLGRLVTGRLYLSAVQCAPPADDKPKRRRGVNRTGSLLL